LNKFLTKLVFYFSAVTAITGINYRILLCFNLSTKIISYKIFEADERHKSRLLSDLLCVGHDRNMSKNAILIILKSHNNLHKEALF